MHSRHVVMSVQLAIAFVHPEDSKSGQLGTLPHPIEPSGSSSALPQILSAPPQALAMLPLSFRSSFVNIAVTLGSVGQFVAGGNCPLVLPCSHLSRALARPCTYLAEAFARLRWHLSGSAEPFAAMVSDIAAATVPASKVRVFMVPSCTGAGP